MADRAYTLESPQTLEEFLAKYKDAINANGEFIPGKANLNYDGLKAADVYQQELGGYTLPYFDSNGQYDASRQGTTIPASASVNADWIEDPRAKGWIAQHPTGALIAGTVLGGVGANMMGLLGSGASAGSSAFGGANSFAGANAVGAGDLSLAAMPQVTASSLGLTGAQAAGAGAVGGGITANVLGAGDLALTTMPEVTASSLGMADAGAGLLGGGAVDAGGGFGAADSGLMGGGEMSGAAAGGGSMSSGGVSVGMGAGATSGLLGQAGQFLKDNPTLTQLGMAGLGALAGGDTKTEATSQKDPWAPAQPYLLENLKKNAALQQQYAQNPFNTQQKAAYQNSFNNSDNFRNNVAPGLLGMVNSFQPYQRQQTAVGGGYKPAQQSGLLSPNMQAPQSQGMGQIDWSQFLPKA